MHNHSTNTDAFDRWQLLDNDNLNLNEVKIRFNDMPQKMHQATYLLDDYHKLFFVSQTVQMVVGGLKPATSFSLDKSLLEEYRQAGLLSEFDTQLLSRVLFDYFSVRVTEKVHATENRVELYVYNPEIMRTLHEKDPRLTPYEDGNINTWLEDNIKKGLNRDNVYGIFFGFPMSAVKQYSKYMTDISCRFEGRKRVSSYGESYYVWGESLKRDVQIREYVKDVFFTNLACNDLYRELVNELQITAQPFRTISQKLFEKTIYSLQIAKDLYSK